MFEIDLKRGSRAPSGASGSDVGRQVRALLPVAAGLVVLVLGLAWLSSRAANEVERRRESTAALEATVAAKRQELASLAGARGAIAATSTKEIYWSDVLRLFSERMPDKIWLADVKITTTAPPKENPNAPVLRTLKVQGGVLSAASEGNLDLIASFLESLQADDRYRESFGPAKLESVTRGSEPHTLKFELTIPFLPA